MRAVDTDALGSVASVLGIGNPATVVAPVDFDDGVLQQHLEVTALIRRARTPAGSSGIFFARFVQTHAGAGQITSSEDPYDISSPGAGWPSPVPEGFDVWILDAQAAAAANLIDNARLMIVHPGTAAAFDQGSATTFSQLIQYWDRDALIGGGAVAFGADPQGIPIYRGPAIRVPRGATISVNSQATGAGDVTLIALLGLFPAALGQDGRA